MATSKQIFNDLELVIRLNQHIEDIAGSDEAAAALLAKQTSFKVLAELDAVRNPDPREDAQFEHQRRAGGHHGDEPDDHALPFHLQGDQDFNRASAISERRALRRSESIKRNVQFLWEVARGRKKADVARISSLDKIGTTHLLGAAVPRRPTDQEPLVIEEGDYMAMMLLIFKVLRDDFDLDVAQLQVHCDWEVDSHHGNSLGFEQFFSAVFELVDLWTCDIMETTYVRFLELLARRITLRIVVFLDDMKLKLALSDNFDDVVVVKAIPLRTIQRFASVAKVVERKGVRTVGELARADPQVVERERLAYLEEKNFSKQKIGAELQHLLDTFNDLTEQVGADSDSRLMYTLENMKLVRRLNTIDPTAADGARSSDPDANSGRVRGMDDARRSVGHTVALEGKLAASPTLFRTSAADAGVLEPTLTATTSPTDGLAFSMNSSGNMLGARSNTRRLSIHDLSQTESGIINSLRSAFILEKRISIVRKHGVDDVRNELEKFGVDATPLSDPEVFEKYGGLYEMFVLRDGESIKALAQTMMIQIKLELQSHGVDVNDEDAEDAYDGFYGSVVATTGEEIVKDAQSWVDGTVANKGAAPYIKADYHELKSLDQVTLIGSQPGDDEFVSLLSNDEDEEDETSAGDDGDEDVAAKPKNGSPIQRKQSQIRAKHTVDLTPKIPKIIVGPAGEEVPNIPVAARYIQLLGLGTVLTAQDSRGLYALLQSDEGRDFDLVCFDIGSQLDTAVEKLAALQRIVGKRVIVLGGSVNEPEKTRAVASECIALGAIYFASLPINFPQLRTEILAFLESSEQPYVLRQRRPSVAGGAFRIASRSIGGVDHFEVHDLNRKLSTPPSYANIARSPRSRKPTIPGSPAAATTTLPALPSIVKEVTNLIHLKALDDIRASEAASAGLVPTSPRSLKSSKKSSPRLSVALQKLMR